MSGHDPFCQPAVKSTQDPFGLHLTVVAVHRNVHEAH